MGRRGVLKIAGGASAGASPRWLPACLDCCRNTVALLLCCAGPLGAGEPSVNPESRTIRHGALDHTYVIQTPTTDGRRKGPVILLLHPSACNGQGVWEQTSLPRIARENGVILAAPDGINKVWNTHWWKGGVDDVGFKTTYRGGREGAEVVHLRIEGGGHTWPGGPQSALGEFFLGTSNRDIDSGTVLWEFFKDKRRAAETP